MITDPLEIRTIEHRLKCLRCRKITIAVELGRIKDGEQYYCVIYPLEENKVPKPPVTWY